MTHIAGLGKTLNSAKKLTRKIRPEQMQGLQNFERGRPFSGE